MIEFFLSAPFVLSAIIIIAVAIAILLEFEKEGWATTLFSVGAALTLWAYKGAIWDVVSNNPLPIVYFVLTYVVLGIGWSIFKWKFYINVKVDKFNSIKSTFIEKNGDIKENWKKWIEYLDSLKYSNFGGKSFYSHFSPEKIVSEVIPQANTKKALIVSWISYWPMSLGATLLNNPFRKFFEWIYSLVSGIYDKMSSNASAKIMRGIEKHEDEGTDKKKKILNS